MKPDRRFDAANGWTGLAANSSAAGYEASATMQFQYSINVGNRSTDLVDCENVEILFESGSNGGITDVSRSVIVIVLASG